MRQLSNKDLGIDVTSKKYWKRFPCIYIVDGKIIKGNQFDNNDTAYTHHGRGYFPMMAKADEVIEIRVKKNKNFVSRRFGKIKRTLREEL